MTGVKITHPMYRGRCIEDAEVMAEAAERAYNGRFSETNDPLDAKADPKSICAQRVTLDLFGESYQLIPRKRTHGWDFLIGGKKVKVMGAKAGGNLLIKQRKKKGWEADVYILCWIIDGDGIVMRWCLHDQVANAPVVVAKKDGRYTVPTHQVSYEKMSSNLRELRVLLGLDYGQEGFKW